MSRSFIVRSKAWAKQDTYPDRMLGKEEFLFQDTEDSGLVTLRWFSR